MAHRLLPLLGILGLAWILVYIGSVIIFGLIAPMPDLLPGTEGTLVTSILKVVTSIILAAVWLLLIERLTKLYVNRKILR